MSIARLLPPEAPKVTRGDILFEGKSILGTSADELVSRFKVALVPEGRHIFGNLTVEENLKIATTSRRDDQKIQQDYQRVYDLFPRLAERRKQRSESLSGGEQQMLSVGRALMTGANFIMLDEPSMGLAPVLMYDMFRALKQLNSEDMTILLVEQNAKIALSFAARAYVLDTGNITLSGKSGEVMQNQDIRKAYLGG
jgi:branched-chain amino acid transport system ATP-binding protein